MGGAQRCYREEDSAAGSKRILIGSAKGEFRDNAGWFLAANIILPHAERTGDAENYSGHDKGNYSEVGGSESEVLGPAPVQNSSQTNRSDAENDEHRDAGVHERN